MSSSSRRDKKADKLIGGYKIDTSDLMDINQLTDKEVEYLRDLDYVDYVKEFERRVVEINKEVKGYSKIRKVPIKKYDFISKRVTDEPYTENIAGTEQPLLTWEVGNPDADFRMVWEAVKHGGERIHRVTLLKALEYIAQPGKAREDILDKVYISVLPVADPMGAHKGTRGYVNMYGDETNNPVVISMRHNRNFFNWADANAAEGRSREDAKGVRISSTQHHFLEVFGHPQSYASCHETVMFPNLAFKNEGLMFLMHHYFDYETLIILQSLKRKLGGKDKRRSFYSKINPLSEGVKYIEDYLENHPSFEKSKSIRNRVRNLGMKVYSDKLEKMLSKMEIPPQQDRDISVDESLLTLGPFYKKAGIILAPDFYSQHGVTNAMTIESFSKAEILRVAEGIAFLEAKLQVEVLDKRYY